MLQLPIGKEASLPEDAFRYERHRPGRTLLYQLVEAYYPIFEAQWAATCVHVRHLRAFGLHC